MSQSSKPYLYKDLDGLFLLAHEVKDEIKSVLEQFNARKIKLSELEAYQRIFLFILTRVIKTYSSILILCSQGFGQDVSTLLRGFLENLITARYIVYDPKTANEKASRFVAYKWIIFKRQLGEQERGLRKMDDRSRDEFIRRKDRILMQVEGFKSKFNVISDRALVTWSGKTVRDMAKEVHSDLLQEYENIFRLCSRFSHPSILGDKEYVIQDEKNLIFSPLPSSIGIALNLKNTIKYAVDFLITVNSLFGFGHEQKLQDLQSRCNGIFTEVADVEPLAPGNKKEGKNFNIKDSTISFRTDISLDDNS